VLFYIRPVETLFVWDRESIELIEKTAQKGSGEVLTTFLQRPPAELAAAPRRLVLSCLVFFTPWVIQLIIQALLLGLRLLFEYLSKNFLL